LHLGSLHSMENSLVSFFPHVPPTVEENAYGLANASGACFGCVVLPLLCRPLAWQAGRSTIYQPKPRPDQPIHFLVEIIVD
jgi:hypothetical protein